ncbi:hypothetical protein DXV75_08350 [Alteromonas aestuariivivens]|uniref:Carbohydrate-binding protein n=1 Tax=Alteromonas aestuariivivens TaxID=1938339 RepID=A0A3D8M9T9_9ALTE|nr:family 43 glycosylhydrolase [Alteromonas aestuariivivens]RDV26080.1 hypothetical protein DXV75_08350 [Alteromonas aestuariivivens]
MNVSRLTLAIALAAGCGTAISKPNVNSEPYPFGNPVIKHMYTADASPHVMPDGRVWMVTSVDLDAGGGYSTMHSYHTFSSANMLEWQDHGKKFNITDVVENENPDQLDWALWAPDMIYRDGKYYLYYPIHIRHRGEPKVNGRLKVTSYIGVAVTDDLNKPFKVLNEHIEGTPGIDPSIFIDDDDQVYLYWGQKWVARLKDNMMELAEPRQQIEIGDDNRFQGKFMEAPWMHKKDGKYYFNYHTKYDGKVSETNPDDPTRQKSELAYSIGNSPMGPLAFGGTLNYELGFGVQADITYPGKPYVPWRLTQSNHGGVVEFHGKDYLFYHTSALSSWRQDQFSERGNWTQRSVSVDEITYDKSGNVIPVQQTLSGPEPVNVTQPYDIILGDAQFDENGIARFENVNMGSGYYYLDTLIANPEEVSGKLEVRLGKPDGYLAGTITLTQKRVTERNGLVDTFLREAEATQDVFLVYKPETSTSPLKLNKVRLFAGAPKPL